MSRITSPHIFTSESVSEGHPDKICDQISDAVLDACLKEDPESRVACETLVTTDLVVLSGEITSNAGINWERVVRGVIRDIGYTAPELGFSADTCKVFLALHPQSPDISRGVTAGEEHAEQGAGDQGMMFGYASDETPELMPAPILYAHKILNKLATMRHQESERVPFLRPDAKSQVSIAYDNGTPVGLDTVVVSHQHTPDMKDNQLRELVEEVVADVVPESLRAKPVNYHINPTGRFVMGGPHGDTGVTGRKIIVDTYGGVGCHGGGAFSGKDPSKVDRSAAYKCRYLAKNIVAAGIARKCEVQVAYAIGIAEPVSINIDTFGTGTIPDPQLQEILTTTDLFDFRPASIIENLGLKYPRRNGWSYRDSTLYGHFGRPGFPWEQTDKAEALRKEVEKKA